MSSVNRTPDFTIAPWGIDTNPGTDESPFATLERARGAVRELAAREPGKDILVSIRGGTYRFGRTVVFGLEDSAGEGRTITYAAHPGETPVFSAGVQISNWRKLVEDPPHIDPKARGKLWVADIPEALKRDLPVTALYDGIEALPRARGKGFPLERDESEVPEDVRRSELRFPEGAFGDWPDITNGDVVVIPRYTWTMNILPLESVDFETRTARTRFPHTYPMLPNRRDEAVWLENVLGVLTSPGEWVYDRKAGRIYLWPRTTEPGPEIVYPALTEMIRIEGSVDYDGPEDTPVRGIRFLGLTFTHGERFQWYGKTGWGIQHDWEAFDRPTAMIRFRGAEGCGVEECRFTAAACTAVRLDLHCRNNRITANLSDHVGGSGVLLCGYGPGLKDANRGNEVSDNHIHHIGEVIWHAPAIFVWQSGDNRIAHNHIHHTGYTGIVVSGRIRWDREGIMECSRTVRWKETAEVVGPDYEQQV